MLTDKVIFNKDGSIQYKFWANEGYKIHDVPSIGLLRFLQCGVKFEEGLTFGTFMDHVFDNEQVIRRFNETFASHLRFNDLHDWEDDYSGTPDDDSEMEWVEVTWTSDYYSNEDKIEISPILHGRSGDIFNASPNDEAYALAFTPLKDLKDYEFRIFPSDAMHDWDTPAEEINLNEPFMVYNKDFTLYDVYTAIFNEISFHGPPSNRKERLDEIKRRVKDFEKQQEQE